jgi:hypothetical protein
MYILDKPLSRLKKAHSICLQKCIHGEIYRCDIDSTHCESCSNSMIAFYKNPKFCPLCSRTLLDAQSKDDFAHGIDTYSCPICGIELSINYHEVPEQPQDDFITCRHRNFT